MQTSVRLMISVISCQSHHPGAQAARQTQGQGNRNEVDTLADNPSHVT